MGTKVLRTEASCKHILESLGLVQRAGYIEACPRCGHRPMNPNVVLNALSRHADVYICEACGMEEAMIAASHEPAIPLKDWALFQGAGQQTETVRPVWDTFVNASQDVRESPRTKGVYQLGLAMEQECPDNDCRIFKNVFNMARELDGAMCIISGYPATVLQRRLHERIGELSEMWESNYAVLAYRAQHGIEAL